MSDITLTSDVYSTSRLRGREISDGWLPAGTVITAASVASARELLAEFPESETVSLRVVGAVGAERAPVADWRAAGVPL